PHCVLSENTEGLKRGAGRRDGISIEIDGRRGGKSVAVLHVRKETKDSLSCRWRQYGRRGNDNLILPLAFVEEVEEGLIANERATQAAAKLIENQLIFRYSLKVIEKRIGIERRVPMRFEETAMKLVGTRSCGKLYLPRPSAKLGIHGGC